MAKKKTKLASSRRAANESSDLISVESATIDPNMATSEAVMGFCQALKQHFDDEKLTDATIHCDGKDFKVHTLILSMHSEYFAKAFNGNWNESKGEKFIKLQEVEADVVGAMLRFMYHFDYTRPDDISAMLFDAKVYSAADMFLLPHLKEHSKAKFKTTMDSQWNNAGFPGDLACVTKHVYCSTPETDRGLRDLVVTCCHQNLKTFSDNEGFRPMLDDVVGFAADLVVHYSNNSGYACAGCGQEKTSWYCNYCGRNGWP
ncbi:BTB/POZ protein [Xylariaceae sp. FL1272]|nr:BTB/POZ protein [Xylariaceae sp. FL1272]